jgi:DNA-binding transcriptional MerR regulator
MEPSHSPATSNDDLDLTVEELAQRVGTSPRTIRYYIAQGLLPGPGARGKSASYGAEHLVRLRLIRLLSARHLPLAEIQALLGGLSLSDARSLLAAEEERSGHLLAAERRQSPRDYLSALLDNARQSRQEFAARPPMPGVGAPMAPGRFPGGEEERAPQVSEASPAYRSAESWSRWALAPGVELHVRADARTAQRALIRRLLLAAGVQDVGDDGHVTGEQ